jgi:drug/metabolite transporter (DMT)-like permease
MSSTARGVGFLVLAVLTTSLQSVAIKWLGGSYSALEIVVIRSLVALPFTLLFYRREGRDKGSVLPTTQHHKLEYTRGLFLFLSYTTAVMGLAALPLADVEAIRFSGPLMITFLSVIMLGEKVGPRHWLALLIGFCGVLLVVRPGSTAFDLGSVFILISVLFYALMVISTRKLHTYDSSATMAYYLVAALALAPLPAVVGPQPDVHPSIAFLIRAWSMPTLLDLAIMAGLGLIWAAWIYFLARAYSLAPASVLAPFEYVALPISIMWGFLIWHEVPSLSTLAGATLTLASGLYIFYWSRNLRNE